MTSHDLTPAEVEALRWARGLGDRLYVFGWGEIKHLHMQGLLQVDLTDKGRALVERLEADHD